MCVTNSRAPVHVNQAQTKFPPEPSSRLFTDICLIETIRSDVFGASSGEPRRELLIKIRLGDQFPYEDVKQHLLAELKALLVKTPDASETAFLPGRLKKDFPAIIKKIRRDKSLSQRKLAKLAGISGVTICLWESGNRNPRLGNLTRLARELGLSLEEFYHPAKI